MIQNLLIVTDHVTHLPSNSLYELAIALKLGNQERKIWVCSRGIDANKDFFMGVEEAPIYATLIDNTFTFHAEGLYFYRNEVLFEKSQVDAILVRLPQPLDKVFLQSLKKIVPAEKIINHPDGTIETSSKAFLMQIAHLCPSPSLCMNMNEAISRSQEQEVVLKPFYSYGGRGIIRLSAEYYWEGDHRYPVSEISSLLTEKHFPMLAMKFLHNVSFGDKRTIVVNQQVLGSAIRMPAANSWICNVANGGHAIHSRPDEDELKIERELTPLLFKKGIIMYGFDTLVDDDGHRVLSEINTLSIGGIGPMSELSGKPLLKQAAELMWEYLEES